MKGGESRGPLLLEISGVKKAFPGVQAVSDASLKLQAGEIHALVGENGAGKSTLIKILTGVHQPDAGEVRLSGEPVFFDNPLMAQRHGIGVIYQEFTLVPTLSVTANLFLGREKTRRGLIDAKGEYAMAHEVFERLGITLEPERRVSELSVAHQQLVEIGRALLTEARLLIMDEPTAALTPREVERLFVILRELSQKGVGIVFIGHRLDEVMSIADRITIMRDGRTIGTYPTGQITRKQLIGHMVGRPIEDEFPKEQAAIGEVCFEARKLSGGKVQEISFVLRRGEVLGMAGLMGAGRTEAVRLIFGADRKTAGEIWRDGKLVTIKSPREAVTNGICLLTEDRKQEGLILKASIKENFALPNLRRWNRLGWIKSALERNRFQDGVAKLNIRASSSEQQAEELSGGNQQKLLVARWLETGSQVIIFDEPTRGIDVGAKYEMYLLINRLAAQGKGIIIISSELPELLGMCDRILVMRGGRISGEITNVAQARQEDVMALAV